MHFVIKLPDIDFWFKNKKERENKQKFCKFALKNKPVYKQDVQNIFLCLKP